MVNKSQSEDVAISLMKVWSAYEPLIHYQRWAPKIAIAEKSRKTLAKSPTSNSHGFLLFSFLRQCAIGACMGRKYCCCGTWLQGAKPFMPFMHLGPYAWILGGLGMYDGLLIGIFPCRFLPKTFQSAIIFCGAGGFLWWQWGNSAAIW